MIMNPLPAYSEAGEKAALAVNQRDESRARHWREHFQAMLRLEDAGYRPQARLAYETAYKAARNIPVAR
jgi:hypothetical protein